MKKYGIDGAFMQRFYRSISEPQGGWIEVFDSRYPETHSIECTLGSLKLIYSQVLQSAKAASQKYGLGFAVEYDISGADSSTSDVVATILNDVDKLKQAGLFDASAYFYHNNAPVIEIWGIGIRKTVSPADTLRIVTGLKQAGYHVIIGVGTDWQKSISDSSSASYGPTYRQANTVQPWTVGGYSHANYKSTLSGVQTSDKKTLQDLGIGQSIVVWPGFSWGNLMHNGVYDQIPRDNGTFYQEQLDGAVSLQPQFLFTAMFDEVNEGTAIMPTLRVNELPVNQRFVGIDNNLDREIYLAKAGSASAALKAGRSNTVKPSLSGSPVDITSGKGGTYPRSNRLQDGALIAAFTTFSNNNNQIALARSTNNGTSWTPLGTAATRPSSSSDVDNAYVLQLPSGRLLVAYRNHDKNPSTGAYTFYRITISYSDNNGATWSYLSDPASDPAGPNGNWEPFLRNALDGSLQLYYSRENSQSDQDNLMRTSRDGGKTWSTSQIISGNSMISRDGMVGVATVSGSRLIAVFESTENGRFSINSVTSSDDGKTWGDRKRVYTPTGNGNNAGAPQVINVGGTLVVSFMTDEDTQKGHWIDGAGGKLIMSADGGSTWEEKIQVFAPQANWPGMVVLDSSSFLYMSDASGAKSQKVVLG
jgi:hypothetical protein